MTTRFTPTDITSTYAAIAALNANMNTVASLFDLCVFRDGSTPNSMLANFDMNHFQLKNVQDASDPTDAVNLAQVNNLIATLKGTTSTFSGFTAGNQTAVGGSAAKVNWMRNDPSAPVQNYGALWSAPITFDHAISKAFPNRTFVSEAPDVAFVTIAKSTGSPYDVVSSMAIADCSVNNGIVFGHNIIVTSGAGTTGTKLVGMELDIQPAAGSTPTTASGIYLNAFTQELPGDAMYIEGVFGGNFATGIRIGKLNAATGAGLYGTGNMGSLVNSATGTYGEAAFVLSNTHRIKFKGSAAANSYLYVDNSDFFKWTIPTNGIAIRDNTDTINLVAISNNSSNGRIDIKGSAGELDINGNKVIGPRQTGTAANATDLATAITLVNDLKTKLMAHGLIS